MTKEEAIEIRKKELLETYGVKVLKYSFFPGENFYKVSGEEFLELLREWWIPKFTNDIEEVEFDENDNLIPKSNQSKINIKDFTKSLE